jgi:hypothetical protein
MKTVHTASGPFIERPHFELAEIDRICASELRKTNLYPATPEPIRIDRFIEKRFKVTPAYEDDLPAGVLGYTEFGSNGVSAIVISRSLAEEDSKVAERRLRTTLAHEGGHGLLHAHLFALEHTSASLFDAGGCRDRQILCRDIPFKDSQGPSSKPSWSEFQANAAIGGLLLPRRLVAQVLEPYLVAVGTLGKKILDPAHRATAITELSETFDVNPVVVRIRLDTFYDPHLIGQLAL